VTSVDLVSHEECMLPPIIDVGGGWLSCLWSVLYWTRCTVSFQLLAFPSLLQLTDLIYFRYH